MRILSKLKEQMPIFTKGIVVFLASLMLTSCHAMLCKEQVSFHHSVVVGKVRSQHPRHQYNEKQYFTPASCQKVITGLLAYKLLGSDFHYTTTLKAVYQEKQMHDAILSFQGDPNFTEEDLYTLLLPLKGQNIPGRIVVDNTFFQMPEWSPNLMIADIGSPYLFPTSAAMINHNLIPFTIQSTKIGKPARIKGLKGYLYHNEIVTTETEEMPIDMYWKGNKLILTGKVPVASSPLEKKIAPTSSQPFLLKIIQKTLNKLNIKATQGIVFIQNAEKLPKNVKIINIHDSEPLKTFLPPAMKASDNLAFDSLYLILLRQYCPHCTKWEEGDPIIRELIKEQLNVDMEKSFLIDGSGVSRYNRIQPVLLWKILQAGFSEKDFIESLVVPGEKDSTLEKRADLPLIKAKTGNILGINCLCGYHLRPTPEAFVLMFSHFAPPVTDIHAVQKSILKRVYSK